MAATLRLDSFATSTALIMNALLPEVLAEDRDVVEALEYSPPNLEPG